MQFSSAATFAAHSEAETGVLAGNAASTADIDASSGQAVRFGATGLLDRSVFNRMDLIYGSEIGAWDMDGGTAINNATARQNVMDAKIRVIRWGNWAKFDYMTQGGSTPKQTLAEFNNAVDGIRSLGAVPFIKLPPIWDQQCTAATDYWNIDWQKEIIRQAGSRVQLYEFGNEPDNYCHLSGVQYGQMWNATVPALKQYARSLGFEIYIGGPAWANSYTNNLTDIRAFLDTVRSGYDSSNDLDYLPDFVSSHDYLTEAQNASLASTQSQINDWGVFYDGLRNNIDQAFSGVTRDGSPAGPQIKTAASEWNYTINTNNANQNDASYQNSYIQAMFTMLRNHDVWLSCQFTIASHDGGALDLLNTDGTAKPEYDAYKAVSTADPLN